MRQDAGAETAAAAIAAVPGRRWFRPVGILLMALSGFAALGYQVVWTQQSALWLGHDAAGILAVVAAFFGGLAAGSLAVGTRIERSLRPTRWYVGCEIVIAGWSVALAYLLRPASSALLEWIGPQPSPAWHWTLAFAGTFLILLPATAAMGATLPAMERMFAHERQRGATLGALYASNTFGAVVGALLTAFVLVPALGLTWTSMACALCNVACAALAWRHLDRPLSPAPATRQQQAGTTPALLLVTGLLGIGYEIVVIRVLSQVSENTVYTFAMLLAVYLVGTALGAAAWQAGSSRLQHDSRTAGRLAFALALACLAGTVTLWWADVVKDWPMSLLGRSFATALAGEALAAALVFLVPAAFMGALFTQLCVEASRDRAGFARELGANTLGAALAPVAFGVLLARLAGPAPALLIIVAGYLCIALLRRVHYGPIVATAAAVATVGLLAPPLRFVDVPEGGHIAFYRDGVLGAVSVVADQAGVARLRIDNRAQEGSSHSIPADGRQALIPLLLSHQPGDGPARALFLGLGTGVTASVAAADPLLEVDAVELLPEVVQASELFREPLRSAGIDVMRAATTRLQGGGDAGASLHVLVADARRYVRTTPRAYDLIVADNYHPARSGSGALYTVEHFDAVRARLVDDGLFCQWLPLHQLDLPTLRSIVRSFMVVFPDAQAVLATNSLETPVVGLMGRRTAHGFAPAEVTGRVQQLAQAVDVEWFGLDGALAVLGSLVAGPAALAAFSTGAPLNTDDRPAVAAMAPRLTYAADSVPADRLAELLAALHVEASDVLVTTTDASFAARLERYWQARTRFLQAGRGVVPVADPAAMLSQVREPLFAVLDLSPDFRPAYEPLLRISLALLQSDPASACAVLQRLSVVRPLPAEAQAAQLEYCTGEDRR